MKPPDPSSEVFPSKVDRWLVVLLIAAWGLDLRLCRLGLHHAALYRGSRRSDGPLRAVPVADRLIYGRLGCFPDAASGKKMRWLILRRGVVGLGAASCAPDAPAALPTSWRISRCGVGGDNAPAALATPQRVSRRNVVGLRRSGCFAGAVAGFATRHRARATRRLLWQRRGGFPDGASGEDDALAGLPTPRLVSQRSGWFADAAAGFPTRRRVVGQRVVRPVSRATRR